MLNPVMRGTFVDSDARNDTNASNGGCYDPLYLANSDYPGAQLIAIQFNGANFLNWSRGVNMALGSKFKQGFINGAYVRPANDSEDYPKWIRTDFMVRCWILNSMIPSISEGFMYIESSKELWDDLTERYAQTNAPLVFQLKRNLANLKQENLSVVDYYAKMKRLWDEIQSVEGFPECMCGALANCSCLLIKRVLEHRFLELIHYLQLTRLITLFNKWKGRS